ncbi:LysE family translocator [Aureimonas psammosilenae]|uniref:LysE family translocator n=1 Tax=Aureimonas psammosilenae TaxID=2495496 RepID=UPI00126076EC|nr:LysE family translocator [Aureimonas psammosilenae]
MGPEFLLTSLIVIASPGTGVLVTLAAGLSRGWHAAVLAAFGCTLGIIPQMVAAMTGLAALLHASALAFEAIRYAGVAYLLFMAWSVLREGGTLRIESANTDRSTRQVLVSAVLVNILNPKLSIFFFAFLPQFVGPHEMQPVLAMGKLSLVFMLMTFAVFVVYGCFAAAVRRHVTERPSVITWMRRAFAAAFVGLALKLTSAER